VGGMVEDIVEEVEEVKAFAFRGNGFILRAFCPRKRVGSLVRSAHHRLGHTRRQGAKVFSKGCNSRFASAARF
jgi:hypothetical protein